MKLKNMTIKRRIVLSNVSMIIAPIVIILVLSPFFVMIVDKMFGVDSVTSSEYSLTTQLQWNFTIENITSAITKDGVEGNKELHKQLTNIEESGSKAAIFQDDKLVYVTEGQEANAIIDKASKCIDRSFWGGGVYSVNSSGLVIVNSIQSDKGDFSIVILNDSYKVNLNEISDNSSFLRDTVRFFAGRFGIVAVGVAVVFLLCISIISIITTRGIIKPINRLKKSTHEIMNGNLDCAVEYDSTNEFGQLINDFNNMREKLKESIGKQKTLERQRKEMIAGISHDLRTPLTSIKGYTEGLMDGIASTPEKQEKYLKTIYTTASDMENLVSDLYLFSKLEVDNVVLDKEETNIIDYMEDCVEEQKFVLEKKEVDITFSSSCPRDTLVLIDRAKFGRVILNILSNSVKYKKNNERCKIKIDITSNCDYVVISFADNGIGIDDKAARHVFETFYRVDQARSNVREGSGLGLSICKQLVDLHDGNIWAFGKLGVGMTVKIALPIVDKKAHEEDKNEKEDIDN